MLNKLWFQLGIGILLLTFIIKNFIDIRWLFDPIWIVITTILIPVLLAGLLFYITVPLQKWLALKMPQWASALLILFFVMALLATGLVFMLEPLINEANKLIQNAPVIFQQIEELITRYINGENYIPVQLEQTVNSLLDNVENILIVSSSYVISFLSGAVSTTLTLILVPFFFFFMLKDHDKFAPAIYNLFKGDLRKWVKKLLEEIDFTLKSYVQGQVLAALILAILLFIGYTVIGLEYALLLALLAFLLNMIPFLGPWLAFLPALTIALIQSPILMIWVSVITLAVQQAESNLITPNIMGKKLSVHPLTVITLVLAAGNLAGFIGMIIAIPGYAVLKVIVINIYQMRNPIKDGLFKNV
ncbi:AI-2E family transporter [Alkalihalobacillus pseudalcaliphilus]|uniref:AI-2E family transporter n=1 Tax=Alkalihalobacillus pseudalcaliphilus TaxID=79884 RepID=UPI00064D99DD|nr:AI-2E family transporter [Alkalihalobacillus pseudalcaliphilus]KMK75287.1 lipoprotein [Alkalihalobacillus pseudalcaliphilus]